MTHWAINGVPLLSTDHELLDQDLIGPSNRPLHRAYLVRAVDTPPGNLQTVGEPVSAVRDFGEYTKYVTPHASQLPALLDQEFFESRQLTFPRQVNVTTSRLELWDTRSVQSIAVLMVDFSGNITDIVSVARWLTSGRFKINNARTAAIVERLCIPGRSTAESKLLEKHILVVPSAAGNIEYNLDALQRIIHRADTPARPGVEGLHFPPQMNRRAYSICAHGPHATVLLGHQEYMENACLTGLCQAVAASERVNKIFDTAITALAAGAVRHEDSTLAELQRNLTDRHSQIQQLHIEIGLNVEAQLESRLLVSGTRIKEYYESIIATNKIRERLHATLRILSRLEQIVRTEGDFLNSAQKSVDLERRRSWSGPLLALPAIAVPLTLVLAYLGANVDEVGQGNSALDFARFGWVYGGILLATLAILLSGLPALLRARRLASRPYARTTPLRRNLASGGRDTAPAHLSQHVHSPGIAGEIDGVDPNQRT